VSGRVHRQTADDGRPRGSIAFSQDEKERTRSLITLFKDRNLSTILHGTGHLWLEELLVDAALPYAPPQLKADMATVRSYLGIEGDAAPTAEQHEKWVRTVEAYFLEGKSPSAELSPVLARFKAWMLSIYKTIKDLHVDIDPDVRGVLDRLIALDVAIAEARAEIGAHALFASAGQAAQRDVTEAEYREVTESDARSQEVAKSKSLARSTADIRRRRGAEWKAKAEAVRKEVEFDVDGEPDLIALHYLRDGTLPGKLAHLRNLPRLRLSRVALVEESGNPAIMSALPKSFQRMVTDKGGVGPSEIAELLGFADGRSLIGALAKLAREQDVLKRAGDKRSVRARACPQLGEECV